MMATLIPSGSGMWSKGVGFERPMNQKAVANTIAVIATVKIAIDVDFLKINPPVGEWSLKIYVFTLQCLFLAL
jgi:hypothetical protein